MKLYNKSYFKKLIFSQRGVLKSEIIMQINFKVFLLMSKKLEHIAMEQGLYSKVVILRPKDLTITEQNKNKNDNKFKFRGQSEISQCWFNIDFDWIEENFSTR